MIYAVKNFLEDYTNFFRDEQMPENVVNAETAVAYISYLSRKASIPVFVLIDEYDNFANELITGGKQNTYKNILHGEGFVKVFYKALKDASADNVARIFMTGVSPIMLDDLTSGFNITMNYT